MNIKELREFVTEAQDAMIILRNLNIIKQSTVYKISIFIFNYNICRLFKKNNNYNSALTRAKPEIVINYKTLITTQLFIKIYYPVVSLYTFQDFS